MKDSVRKKSVSLILRLLKGVILINTTPNQKKWIYVSIPILFALGTIFHFLYQLSNKSFLAAIISPVNESVWEHSKLLLFPILAWWVIFYALKGYKYNLNIAKWFTGMLVSILSSILTTFFVYYFYTEAFGVELLLVDILILLLSDSVGQLLGYHIAKHSPGINVLISISLVVLIFIAYLIWTVNPPHLPLFFDKSS